MNQRLWLDCDGVLLDWVTPFLKHSGLSKKGLKYEDIFNYDFSLLFTNGEDFMPAMHDFHTSEVFKRLPSLVEREDLQVLKDAGFSLNVITALENDAIARSSRILNLSYHFGGVIDSISFVEHGVCKLDAIKQKYPADKIIIVEDQPKLLRKASDWCEYGLIEKGVTDLIAYGVVHPYNEAALNFCPYIVRVQNTKDAINRIIRSTYIV